MKKKQDGNGPKCKKTQSVVKDKSECRNTVSDFDKLSLQSIKSNNCENNPTGRSGTFISQSLSTIQKTNLELKGRYKCDLILGKGSSGVVLRGLSHDTKDHIAIKRTEKHFIDQCSLHMIKKEVDLLKKLDHRNIVKFYDFIETEHTFYVILEYAERGSLSSILKRFGIFGEKSIVIYIQQILYGLKYLHENRIVHRDIKGDNILITKDGKVKLADFGTAILEDENLQSVVGTPYWMAPEVIQLSSCGPASDIWSLSCTVIELLTGKPPYYDLGTMSALFNIVEDKSPPIPDFLSEEMTSFLKLCFKKHPSERPTSEQLLEHPLIKKYSQCNILDIDTIDKKSSVYNQSGRHSIFEIDWKNPSRIHSMDINNVSSTRKESNGKISERKVNYNTSVQKNREKYKSKSKSKLNSTKLNLDKQKGSKSSSEIKKKLNRPYRDPRVSVSVSELERPNPFQKSRSLGGLYKKEILFLEPYSSLRDSKMVKSLSKSLASGLLINETGLSSNSKTKSTGKESFRSQESETRLSVASEPSICEFEFDSKEIDSIMSNLNKLSPSMDDVENKSSKLGKAPSQLKTPSWKKNRSVHNRKSLAKESEMPRKEPKFLNLKGFKSSLREFKLSLREFY